jgi:putative ABC transport system substrate-binding protein
MARLGRRDFLCAAGGVLVASRGWAQAPERTYRLGVLGTSSAAMKDAHWIAFFKRLGELGLVEGRNLTIELRNAENRLETLPALARELARRNCDVFFSGASEASLHALASVSRDTPIVIVAVDFDPVATGVVSNLARPGGRVTGVTAMQATMPAKRLELLKELLPRADKVAVFANRGTTDQLAVVRDTGPRLGMTLQVIEFTDPPFDYRAGVARALEGKADALFVLGSGLFVSGRRTIIELARNARLPTVFHHAGWVEAGGLMSYGFNFPALWRRGAEMVAAILRGAKAGDMPVEQPQEFELAINMKTARGLGVAVPQSILLRADRLFE